MYCKISLLFHFYKVLASGFSARILIWKMKNENIIMIKCRKIMTIISTSENILIICGLAVLSSTRLDAEWFKPMSAENFLKTSKM